MALCSGSSRGKTQLCCSWRRWCWWLGCCILSSGNGGTRPPLTVPAGCYAWPLTSCCLAGAQRKAPVAGLELGRIHNIHQMVPLHVSKSYLQSKVKSSTEGWLLGGQKKTQRNTKTFGKGQTLYSDIFCFENKLNSLHFYLKQALNWTFSHWNDKLVPLQNFLCYILASLACTVEHILSFLNVIFAKITTPITIFQETWSSIEESGWREPLSLSSCCIKYLQNSVILII